MYTSLGTGSDVSRSETSQCNPARRSEEHTSELQSQSNLVCRLLLEKTESTNISGRLATRMRRAVARLGLLKLDGEIQLPAAPLLAVMRHRSRKLGLGARAPR